ADISSAGLSQLAQTKRDKSEKYAAENEADPDDRREHDEAGRGTSEQQISAQKNIEDAQRKTPSAI
ncbi:hypothetical protein LTR94_032588, partial [Friedmanniomyces endolithicus]